MAEDILLIITNWSWNRWIAAAASRAESARDYSGDSLFFLLFKQSWRRPIQLSIMFEWIVHRFNDGGGLIQLTLIYLSPCPWQIFTSYISWIQCISSTKLPIWYYSSYQMSRRFTSVHRKTILPKFLLVLSQKPITTYANPGVLLVKFYPLADLLHHPSENIADLKTKKI